MNKAANAVNSHNTPPDANPDPNEARSTEPDRGEPAMVGPAITSKNMTESADLAQNVSRLAAVDRRQKLRIVEALLFASARPLSVNQLAEQLTEGDDVVALLEELRAEYAERGVNLVRVAGRWAFRTAGDLGYLLERHAEQERRLSKAALETLAIVAYHQPVTRAEIEQIRGVVISKGTLDALMETGWVRMRGRRRAPGRPITYGTSPEFLEHFGLDGLSDLPGLAELKGAGLLDGNLPPGFTVPDPRDLPVLASDEDPLDDGDDAQSGLALEDEMDAYEPGDASGDESEFWTDSETGCDQGDNSPLSAGSGGLSGSELAAGHSAHGTDDEGPAGCGPDGRPLHDR